MKVRLMSATEYPVETIYALWHSSRSSDPILTPEEYHEARLRDPGGPFEEEMLKTFRQVIASDIPVAENLDFVFLLEEIPISLREQLVRHRIGHKFGENFGVDIIPGPVDSSFWSQTMRVLDMSSFATDGHYFTPETINNTPIGVPGASSMREVIESNRFGVTRKSLYDSAMKAIEEIYSTLVQAGVPIEDARQLIPLGACSRLSWKVNFRALKGVLNNRSCWIAQLGMWKPIVFGMVEELCKLDPIFRKLINPPCYASDGEYEGCPFPADNLARVNGTNDPGIPCPLFLGHERKQIDRKPTDLYQFDGQTWDTTDGEKREQFKNMRTEYAKMWRRNPWTGDKYEENVQV